MLPLFTPGGIIMLLIMVLMPLDFQHFPEEAEGVFLIIWVLEDPGGHQRELKEAVPGLLKSLMNTVIFFIRVA